MFSVSKLHFSDVVSILRVVGEVVYSVLLKKMKAVIVYGDFF